MFRKEVYTRLLILKTNNVDQAIIPTNKRVELIILRNLFILVRQSSKQQLDNVQQIAQNSKSEFVSKMFTFDRLKNKKIKSIKGHTA